MSIADEYVTRAEECERLANKCVAESNRAILLYAAGRWRKMAEEEAGRPAPPAPLVQATQCSEAELGQRQPRIGNDAAPRRAASGRPIDAAACPSPPAVDRLGRRHSTNSERCAP